jgi:hypothetical protein
VDVTPFLPVGGGPVVLALQTMQFSGVDPNTGTFPFKCATGVQCNGPTQISRGPAVLMHLDLHTASGGTSTVATEAAAGWKVLNADGWLRPAIRSKVCYYPGCGDGSGSGRVEHTDARHEPLGWRSSSSFDDSSWSPAVAISTPSLTKSQLVPRMAGAAVEVTPEVAPIRTTPAAPSGKSFFVEWKQEFSGGLRLTVKGGKAGQAVRFVSGELCTPLVWDAGAFDGRGQNVSTHCDTVEQDWGWDFNWTLREGAQTIEQHQYMIFRYLTVEWLGDAPPPAAWSVSAWGVNAPFDETETHFASSDPVLDRVWGLAANMEHRGVLDTYTDSNARERRPYEADGLITAGNRMLLQSNNVMWARHSHSWIFTYPTWPVEWLMITPMLAYMDYWATGSAELADAYFELLFNNTQYPIGLDHALNLMNTSRPGSRDVELWNYTGGDSHGRRRGGRHLIGWAPAPIDDASAWMWSASDFMSVPNFYTVKGLELLAELGTAAGRAADAAKCAQAAKGLRTSILAHMWDPKVRKTPSWPRSWANSSFL